jgi:non-heme chloroperoxidase
MLNVITKMVWLVAPVIASVAALHAQDIAGDWQGTLKVPNGQLRLIVNLAKSDDGGWKTMMYSIDQGTEGSPADSTMLQGSSLKFTIDAIHGTFEGTVSGDGASIEGTWTQGRPLTLELKRATKETAWPRDPAPHTIQFVTVDNNVKLEVLDFGGSGRPLILLTGLGNNAHVFDRFAPKLSSSCHVYAITRRGFGASSSPPPVAANYTADRLGDDVLAAIDGLKINRPVLVGHSIAGEELSSIGSRHPEKVSGLVYLDAGYGYAFYDRMRGDLLIDAVDLQRKLAQLLPGSGTRDMRQLVDELLHTTVPQFEKDLQETQKQLAATPPPPTLSGRNVGPTPAQAIMAGQQKYTNIKGPVLAIYAVPHDRGRAAEQDEAARAAADAEDIARVGAQAKAFETGVPSARVVRLPHANHYVFRSNEADVLREMNAFFASLPE